MGKRMKIIYTPRGAAREYGELAFNGYIGCVHKCTYCYVPGVLRMDRAKFHACATPKKDALEKFEHDCRLLQERDNHAPIFMSFTTDPYQPCEDEYGLTREAIKIAHQFGQNVNILTKAGGRAEADLPLLQEGDIFGITLTSWECRREPNAAYSLHRINALKEAHRRGIETRVSFEPLTEPIEIFGLIEAVRSAATLIQVGKWNYSEEARLINWKLVARQVRDYLERIGGAYYIKNDLRQYLGAVVHDARPGRGEGR